MVSSVVAPEAGRLGRYRLIERIAVGGMAEVFLAKLGLAAGLEKTVVVKTILPQRLDSPRAQAMMLDEARIGFSLRHENIVQVLDVGREEDTLFVALEFIDGVDFAQLLKAYRKTADVLPPHAVAFVGAKVLRGLDYAHRRTDDGGEPLHIVHRDISPHNVLLSQEGEVKLTDFGIGRVRDRIATTTTTGAVKGKLGYMAPEQARGAEHVDWRTDLFGVAATLYDALCGEPPFNAPSEFEMFQRTGLGLFVPLRERRPELPRALSDAIDQALDSDPDQRPSSASAFARPLEDYAHAQGMSAEILAEHVRRAVTLRDSSSRRAAKLEQVIFGRGRQGATRTGRQTAAATDAPATQTVARSAVAAPAATDTIVDTPRRRTRKLMSAAVLVLAGAAALAMVLWMTGVIGTTGAPSVATKAVPPPDASAVALPGAGPHVDAAIVAPIDAAAGAPADADSRVLSVDAGTKPAKPVVRPRRKYGTIVINSFPVARVYVDNRYVGQSQRSYRLRVGRRRVRLVNAQNERTRRKTVVIKEGRGNPPISFDMR